MPPREPKAVRAWSGVNVARPSCLVRRAWPERESPDDIRVIIRPAPKRVLWEGEINEHLEEPARRELRGPYQRALDALALGRRIRVIVEELP